MKNCIIAILGKVLVNRFPVEQVHLHEVVHSRGSEMSCRKIIHHGNVKPRIGRISGEMRAYIARAADNENSRTVHAKISRRNKVAANYNILRHVSANNYDCSQQCCGES